MASKYISAYESLAKLYSQKSGTKLICKGDSFMTDGKTVIIPEIPDELNKELRDPTLAGILHESQHIVHTKFMMKDPKEMKKIKHLLAARGLHNNLEDIRLYELGKKEYRGYHSLQETGLNYIRDNIIIPSGDNIDTFTMIGGCLQYRISGIDDSFFSDEVREITDLIEPLVREVNWLPRIEGENQSRELTEKILKTLKLKADEDEEKQEQEQQKKKEQDKKEQQDEDQKDSNQEGKEKSKKDKDEEQQEEENEEKDEMGGGENEEEDEVEDEQYDEIGENEEENTSSGNQDETEISSSKKNTSNEQVMGEIESLPMKLMEELKQNEEEIEKMGDEIDQLKDEGIMNLLEDIISKIIKSHNTENDRHIPHPDVIQFDEEQTIQEYAPEKCADLSKLKKELVEITSSISTQTKLLKAKILPLLMAEKRTSFLVDQDEGKLDGSRIYRIPQGDKNVYRKKVPGKRVDTAVSILCDVSGSMSGPPMQMLKQALIVVSDSLTALKIPFEILAFTTHAQPWEDERGILINSEMKRILGKVEQDKWHNDPSAAPYNRFYPIRHIIVKAFNENYRTARDFIPALSADESNVDGEALEWSIKRLSMQRQQRKIQIVMSDGRPAIGWASPEILEKDLQEKVNKAEKSGIEVIGIGILTNLPKKFYPTFVYIESINEIASKTYEALLQKLKQ